MITIQLMGGLGNQLFQIFTLINIALEEKIVFKFPLNKRDLVSPHDNTCIRPTYWDTIFKYINKFCIQFEETCLIIKEQSFNYNKIKIPNEMIKLNFKLDGYFQSYKYFEKIKII